ncbi:MAG: Glycosyltransferase involved in cell wall biogenesis [Parcubacteria group bacterium GW2011_GWC2_45_7]|nr:MAG: Glycosyltransferase involved in cell wall biogenesis [Parcubacteria group bacterium GW2011_GWC2_45_7]
MEKLIPLSIRCWMWRVLIGESYSPPLGWVEFGSLRRIEPISREYGRGGGHFIDRYYIERFLSDNAPLVRGRVLEVGDNNYTRRFGGNRVTRSDVLHVAKNPRATFIDDLATGTTLPPNAFDCFICTQTLQYIPDMDAAIQTIFRILKPQGVLLATVPGLSYHNPEADPWGYFAMFTRWSAREHFGRVFPPDHLDVRSHGNVLASISFLQGLACEDVRSEELDYNDDFYQLCITIKAVKPIFLL